MNKPIKRVAVIHDLCVLGKAALTNIVPILSVSGLEVCPIPTLTLSTHTGGFGAPAIQNMNNFFYELINHYKSLDIKFNGIFIGYLGNEENLHNSINFIKSFGYKNDIPILFDPICGDDGKLYSNFDSSYVDNIRTFIKFANIITPNYTEACLLSRNQYKNKVSDNDIYKICIELASLGAKTIIITSVPVNEDKLGVAVYDSEKNKFKLIVHNKEIYSYPGTGDIFSSVLFSNIVNKKDIFESVKSSINFTRNCIIESSKYDYPRREGVLLEKFLKDLI